MSSHVRDDADIGRCKSERGRMVTRNATWTTRGGAPVGYGATFWVNDPNAPATDAQITDTNRFPTLGLIRR